MPLNRNHAAASALGDLLHTGSFTALSDGQLLERFATRAREAGEPAFAALVARHGPLVWRTCQAVLRDDHDARDAFQATFLVLVRRAGSLWVSESIGPWLHRVAFRTAVHAKRDKNRRRAVERQAAERTPAWTVPSISDDLSLAIHQEVERLPDRHRIPLVLCDLEGRSYEEAARHLGCPVGTVKSRLARGRAHLQDRLIRRGITPSSAQQTLIMIGAPTSVSLPPALLESTVRAAAAFAVGPLQAACGLSALSITLAEGVLKVMLFSRLKMDAAVLATIIGLSTLGWLAHAAPDDSPRPAPAPRNVEKNTSAPTVDLQGNWIVRGYPSGQAMSLIKIEGRRASARATLLAILMPEHYHFAESTIENFQIDDKAVRFTLKIAATRPIDARVLNVVAYLPKDQAEPKVLRGSIDFSQQGQFPAILDRTDLKELDPKEALAAGNDELRRFNQTKDREKQVEILKEMLKKYAEEPMAPVAGWALAITLADDKAPTAEVRAAVDRAIEVAARYGPEMEVGTINLIVRNLVGAEDLEDLTLEYARKAEAMLRASYPVALQENALQNLVNVLPKSRKIDEAAALAEIKTVEARLAKLGIPAAAETQRKPGAVHWARNFAAARKEAAKAGKLVMVDFSTQTCGWCKRLDADVFPKPAVVEAMRRFVPVKVDAEDGEGRPLVERYQAHIQGYPAILFLDPAIEDAHDGRIVGKIPGYTPPLAFVELLNVIAGLPRDLPKLREQLKAHADDDETARRLATSLAMQGELMEAGELAGRPHGKETDPTVDSWASVYNTIGDELLIRQKPAEAAEWYDKAGRTAKRPIDVYLARVGVGMTTAYQGKPEEAVKELEAAAGVVGVSGDEREFAQTLLKSLKADVKTRPSTPK
ncbi:sigma-70 family RNA polymerase sigma factor [Paludisphaera borealis]|uniref:ECF RNA polymerase sigma factor SigE n=1 Tax=Paludisphaera borealis TaxID=1387353 RepID=A0A1U7CJK8_9BACT|nr:sigma-70 family RNA polymerase sigma factor [Paludisphaera borealis]APW59121.1 ECF RNA polymerase sigma factor SigE [Paludisphaera borealis]